MDIILNTFLGFGLGVIASICAWLIRIKRRRRTFITMLFRELVLLQSHCMGAITSLESWEQHKPNTLPNIISAEKRLETCESVGVALIHKLLLVQAGIELCNSSVDRMFCAGKDISEMELSEAVRAFYILERDCSVLLSAIDSQHSIATNLIDAGVIRMVPLISEFPTYLIRHNGSEDKIEQAFYEAKVRNHSS